MDKQHPDLYQKVIKGSFWIFSLKISSQLLSMLRFIVLARLLAPKDFGLLGVALLLMNIFQTFTETGFRSALIQKRENIYEYLNTVWTVNIIRGVVLYLVVFIIAPLAAKLKIPPEQIQSAIWIIRVTALSLIIDSFTNIGTIYFPKEMEFNKPFILGAISNLCGLIASIVIAVIYKNPWALVCGKLVNSVVAVLLSYKLHSYHPKLSYSIAKARELWRFGRWITLSSGIVFLENYSDDFFVWFAFGPEALAIYQMAYKIAMFPVDFSSNLISQITLPAFSKISNDLVRLKKAYLKTYRLVSNLAMPISASICILAPPLIPLAMGEKWLPTVLLVQILTLKGVVQTLGITRGPLFMSLSKHGLATKFIITRAIVLVVLLYPLSQCWQLIGVCVAVVISTLAPMIPAYALANRLINANRVDIFRESKQAVLFSIIAIILSFLIRYVIGIIQ